MEVSSSTSRAGLLERNTASAHIDKWFPSERRCNQTYRSARPRTSSEGEGPPLLNVSVPVPPPVARILPLTVMLPDDAMTIAPPPPPPEAPRNVPLEPPPPPPEPPMSWNNDGEP